MCRILFPIEKKREKGSGAETICCAVCRSPFILCSFLSLSHFYSLTRSRFKENADSRHADNCFRYYICVCWDNASRRRRLRERVNGRKVYFPLYLFPTVSILSFRRNSLLLLSLCVRTNNRVCPKIRTLFSVAPAWKSFSKVWKILV